MDGDGGRLLRLKGGRPSPMGLWGPVEGHCGWAGWGASWGTGPIGPWSAPCGLLPVSAGSGGWNTHHSDCHAHSRPAPSCWAPEACRGGAGRRTDPCWSRGRESVASAPVSSAPPAGHCSAHTISPSPSQNQGSSRCQSQANLYRNLASHLETQGNRSRSLEIWSRGNRRRIPGTRCQILGRGCLWSWA